jgi:hypothetical protein
MTKIMSRMVPSDTALSPSLTEPAPRCYSPRFWAPVNGRAKVGQCSAWSVTGAKAGRVRHHGNPLAGWRDHRLFLQGFAVGADGLVEPCRPNLPFAQAPKRRAETRLGPGPIEWDARHGRQPICFVGELPAGDTVFGASGGVPRATGCEARRVVDLGLDRLAIERWARYAGHPALRPDLPLLLSLKPKLFALASHEFYQASSKQVRTFETYRPTQRRNDRYVYDRVCEFLRKRHKTPGRGTKQFIDQE